MPHRFITEDYKPKERAETRVVGRWGATTSPSPHIKGVGTRYPEGQPSIQVIIDRVDEAIKDEQEAADFYRDLANMLRRQGLKYFPIAADIDEIAKDELDHLSRLTFLKGKLVEMARE